MTDILMPALSPTMEEGTLSKWLVAVGDRVRPGDPIAEIETDKAAMEVEAASEGVVDALLVAQGEEGVRVNTPIARLRRDGAEVAPAAGIAIEEGDPLTLAGPQPLSPSVRRIVAEQKLDHSTIIGTGRGGRLTKADVLGASDPRSNGASVTINASPLAARIAQARGVDLACVSGSGPEGRILKADLEVLRLGRSTLPEPARDPGASGLAGSSEGQGVSAGAYDLAPLDSMRKTIARRMTDSFRDVPHFPLSIDVEFDELMAFQSRINAALEPDGVKASVNDLIVKAVAFALKQTPEVNASYTPEGIALHHHADIAVAVAIEGGLITPVIRAAETKGVGAIARETKDLAARARSKRLKPEEHQGGTFTISNLGMFGIRSFSSIINPPQGAILSVGAAELRPTVRDEKLAVATIATISLTCDHRAMDGVAGARFLSSLRRVILSPLLLLA